MWFVLWAAFAAASPLSEELSAELLARPDHDARLAYIAEQMASATDEESVRLANALSVITMLKQGDRNGALEVMRFIEASVADSPSRRAQAVSRATDPESMPDSEAMAVPQPDPEAPAAMSVPPQIDAASLRQYRQKRLVRGDLSVTVGSMSNGIGQISTVNTWGVSDGGGSPYTARTFADAIGDQALADRMKRRRRSATGATVGLAVGGAVLAGIGLAMATRLNITDSEYATGIIVGSVGAAALGTSYMPLMYTKRKQQYVSRFYSADEADSHIADFNGALATELGIDEDTALEIEMAD